MSPSLQKAPNAVKANDAEEKKQIYIVKLSELVEKLKRMHKAKKTGKDVADGSDGLELPNLCRIVHQSDVGCETCLGVVQKVQKLLGKVSAQVPCLLFCCELGAKGFLFKIGSEVYMAICRSPERHPVQAERAARACGLSSDLFAEHWTNLCKFNKGFVDRVLQALEDKDLEVSPEMRQGMVRLGKGYGLFEFDIVVYDVLQAISEENGDHPGLVKVEFVSEHKNNPVVRIVRIARCRIGEFDESEDEQKGDMLIVGFAIGMQHSGDLKSCLGLPEVLAVNKALDEDTRRKYKIHISWLREWSTWSVKATVFLKEEPDSTWKEHVEALINAAVDSGAGTVLDHILQNLANDDWDNFRKDIFTHSNRVVHQTSDGELNTLYSLVFGDLAAVVGDLGRRDLLGLGAVKLVFNRLFRLIKDYPRYRVDFDTTAEAERRKLLLRDFLSGSVEYNNMLNKEIMPLLKLERYGYNTKTVQECLKISPDKTVKSMLLATEAKLSGEEWGIDLKKGSGREAWNTVLKFYRDRGLVSKEEFIQQRLYEITAPESKKGRESVWREFKAELLRVATLGLLSPSSTVSYAQQRAYRKHMDELGLSILE